MPFRIVGVRASGAVVGAVTDQNLASLFLAVWSINCDDGAANIKLLLVILGILFW